jgi:hypothetical protein
MDYLCNMKGGAVVIPSACGLDGPVGTHMARDRTNRKEVDE